MYLRAGRCLLRVHRRRKKITQRQIAERLDVSIQMISKIENNARTLSYEAAMNVANLLDINMEQLYEWIPDKRK